MEQSRYWKKNHLNETSVSIASFIYHIYHSKTYNPLNHLSIFKICPCARQLSDSSMQLSNSHFDQRTCCLSDKKDCTVDTLHDEDCNGDPQYHPFIFCKLGEMNHPVNILCMQVQRRRIVCKQS